MAAAAATAATTRPMTTMRKPSHRLINNNGDEPQRIEHVRRDAMVAAEKERVRTKRSAMNAIDAALTLIHGLHESLITQPPTTTTESADNGNDVYEDPTHDDYGSPNAIDHQPNDGAAADDLSDNEPLHYNDDEEAKVVPLQLIDASQSSPPSRLPNGMPASSSQGDGRRHGSKRNAQSTVAAPLGATIQNDVPPPLPLSRPPSFIPATVSSSRQQQQQQQQPTTVQSQVIDPLLPSPITSSSPPIEVSMSSSSSSPLRHHQLLAPSSPLIASARLHADSVRRKARQEQKRAEIEKAKQQVIDSIALQPISLISFSFFILPTGT
jgi:hypothetical protein